MRKMIAIIGAVIVPISVFAGSSTPRQFCPIPQQIIIKSGKPQSLDGTWTSVGDITIPPADKDDWKQKISSIFYMVSGAGGDWQGTSCNYYIGGQVVFSLQADAYIKDYLHDFRWPHDLVVMCTVYTPSITPTEQSDGQGCFYSASKD